MAYSEPKGRPVTGAGPCGRIIVRLPQSSGARERCPVRAFKETDGTPKWSASEIPRGLSGGCQCGRLMVVFVLLGSLFLFVPFDPGQQVLEIRRGELPFERSGGG